MEATGIGAAAVQGTAPAGTSARELSDQFLHLLVAQLKNQDPTNPIQNEEFITQLAQLETLDKQQQLAETNQAMLLQSSLATGASLIDKQVSGFTLVGGERTAVTGILKSIRVENGSVVYQLETDSGVVSMSPEDIVGVFPKPQDN